MYRPNCMLVTSGTGGVYVNRMTDGDMLGSLLQRITADDLVAVEDFLVSADSGQDMYIVFPNGQRGLLVKITPGINVRNNSTR